MEEKNQEQVIHVFDKKDFVTPEERIMWTKGDLVITCHNCGHENLLQKGIENGIRIDLFTNNTQEIRLECTECNSAMSMHFVMSEDAEIFVPPTQEEIDAKIKAEADATDAEMAAETVTEGRVIDLQTKEEIIEEEYIEVSIEPEDELTKESTEA